MKILVTGGAGFIGSHIVDLLINRGHTVWIADDLSSGRFENINEKAIFAKGDIANFEYLYSLARNLQPDAIIHEAAQASLLRSVNDPIIDAEINILGTLNVIQTARKFGAHVIFASTSAVYDSFADTPYDEISTPINPTRPYGIAKCAAEMYLRHSGLSYTILRYGNVYGPRQVAVGENQVIPRALDFILHGKPFVVNGTGDQTRDFVYVADVAAANVLAAEKKPNGTFNISTGRPASVNYILDNLAHSANFSGKFEHGPGKPNEPLSVALKPQRAEIAFSWLARVMLEDGLKRTYNWSAKQ